MSSIGLHVSNDAGPSSSSQVSHRNASTNLGIKPNQTGPTTEAVHWIAKAFCIKEDSAKNYLDGFFKIAENQLGHTVITGSTAVYVHWANASTENKQFQLENPDDFDVFATSLVSLERLNAHKEMQSAMTMDLSQSNNNTGTRTIKLDVINPGSTGFFDTKTNANQTILANSMMLFGLKVAKPELLLKLLNQQISQLCPLTSEEKVKRVKSRLEFLEQLCKTNEQEMPYLQPTIISNYTTKHHIRDEQPAQIEQEDIAPKRLCATFAAEDDVQTSPRPS